LMKIKSWEQNSEKESQWLLAHALLATSKLYLA
jgi:hypothetical protein